MSIFVLDILAMMLQNALFLNFLFYINDLTDLLSNVANVVKITLAVPDSTISKNKCCVTKYRHGIYLTIGRFNSL